MASDPPSEDTDRRETTVRVVKSGIFRLDSEDPVERYEHHFVHLVERHLQQQTRPVLALDLACGNGFATLTLWPQLPEGSRVIAIGDDRAKLKLFHEQLTGEHRHVIFPRKERTDRLPFALSVFDIAWATLALDTLEPLRPSLRQTLRLLRPAGQLVVAAPLRDTFIELAGTLGNLLEEKGQGDTFRSLMTDPPDLLDLDGWTSTFTRCGAVDVQGHRETVAISIDAPLSSQRLFCQQLLPLWLGDDPTLQARALRLLDDHIIEPVNVTVCIGCITGQRSKSDFDQSIGS